MGILEEFTEEINKIIDDIEGKKLTKIEEKPEENKTLSLFSQSKKNKEVPISILKKEQDNITKDDKQPNKSFLAKSEVYKVYLILDNDDTIHTKITKYKNKDKLYYILDFNKKIYDAEKLEANKGEFNKYGNFLFLEGEELIRGKGKFSDKAKEEIAGIETMKLEDRAFQKSTYRMKEKYSKPSGINVIVAFIIICVGLFLILWVLLGGLPPIINAINNAAHIAIQPPNFPVEPLANESYVVS